MNKVPSKKDKQQKQRKVYQATAKNLKSVVEQALRENQPDPDLDSPSFSFRYANQENLNLCNDEDKMALLGTMQRLSLLTWKQVHSLGRHALGFEVIPSGKLQFPIPSAIPSDVRFMVFRFSGMKPMVGFRQASTFCILWLDYDFSAYDHR